MRFTFIDTFFAGAEFSSVYRLGNLFCTVPFRKITFVIDQVGFFFSIGSIFCIFKILAVVTLQTFTYVKPIYLGQIHQKSA